MPIPNKVVPKLSYDVNNRVHNVVYVEEPVDDLVKRSEINGLMPATDSYTKPEVDASLTAKADKTAVYTKAEVDAKIPASGVVTAWKDVPDSWLSSADYTLFKDSANTMSRYFMNMQTGFSHAQYRIDGNTICFKGFLVRNHRKNDNGTSMPVANDGVPLAVNTVADFTCVLRLPLIIDGVDLRLTPKSVKPFTAPNVGWRRPSTHCGPTVPADYRHPATTNDNVTQSVGLNYSDSQTVVLGQHSNTPHELYVYAGDNDRSSTYINKVGLKISCGSAFLNPRAFSSVEPTVLSLNGVSFEFIRMN